MKKGFIAMVMIAGLMICNVYAVENDTTNNVMNGENSQVEEEIKIEKELYEGVPITYKEKYLTRIGCIDNILDFENIFARDSYPDDINTGFKDIGVYIYAWDLPEYKTLCRLFSAKRRGIVKGYPDGTFRPNEMITKEDMYLMMYRLLTSNLRGNVPPIPEADISLLDEFSDGSEVSDYAKEAVVVMLQLNLYGIEDGEIKLDPKGNILVEDAKKVFERFYDFYVIDASESE